MKNKKIISQLNKETKERIPNVLDSIYQNVQQDDVVVLAPPRKKNSLKALSYILPILVIVSLCIILPFTINNDAPMIAETSIIVYITTEQKNLAKVNDNLSTINASFALHIKDDTVASVEKYNTDALLLFDNLDIDSYSLQRAIEAITARYTSMGLSNAAITLTPINPTQKTEDECAAALETIIQDINGNASHAHKANFKINCNKNLAKDAKKNKTSNNKLRLAKSACKADKKLKLGKALKMSVSELMTIINGNLVGANDEYSGANIVHGI